MSTVGCGGAQGVRGGQAPAADPDRRAGAARDQQRLVADLRGRRCRADREHRVAAAPMAARDHAWAPAGLLQRLHERDHGRRLAGAADDEVADDQHRHRRALRAASPRQRREQRVEPGQRQQQPHRRRRARLPPVAGQQRLDPRGDGHRCAQRVPAPLCEAKVRCDRPIAARGVEHVDDRLLHRHRVGRDDDHRVGAAGGGAGHRGGELLDAAPVQRLAVDRVAAVGGHRDDDLGRPVAQLVGVGGGQRDLQFGEARVGGGQHQEDQHHQQHVDERDQVDLRLLGAATAELHGPR